MLRLHKLAGILALALGSIASAHSKSPFDGFAAFGDSLTDNGNDHSIGQGTQQRFTTNPGKVTAEYLAELFGFYPKASAKGGSDFAWGGARAGVDQGPVLSMRTQVDRYLASNNYHADPNKLYTAWIGANDVIAAFNLDDFDKQIPAVSAAANTEIDTIQQLHNAGARYVVVFNLPDIAETPRYRNRSTVDKNSIDQLVSEYNDRLDIGLNNVGVGIIPVNAYALLNQIMADPARYGIGNVTGTACKGSSINCDKNAWVSADADRKYLFADGIHPTSAGHALLGAAAYSEIIAPMQISLLSEAPLAMSAAQNRALRYQMLVDAQGGTTRFFANVDHAQQRFNAGASSPKTSSTNTYLTVGTDVRAGDYVSTGLALGLGHANAKVSGGGGYKLMDFSALSYVTVSRHGGYAGMYASFGQSNFSDSQRSIKLGPATVKEIGKTNGSHLGAGLAGGWWFDVGRLRTGPFANLEWHDIKVTGYHEKGTDALAMWFGRQHRKALIGTLGWRLLGHYTLNQAKLYPYLDLGWNKDSKARQDKVLAGLNSMGGRFEMPGFLPDKKWVTADVGVSVHFDHITTWLGYSGRFADKSQKYHSVNLGMKFAF